jgi:signal peptidase I
MTENPSSTEPVKTPEPEKNSEPVKTPESEPEIPTLFPRWLSGLGRFALEIVEVVVFSLVIILPIRYFLIQPFYVHGASMEPNFQNNEYLIVDELSQHYRPIQRGEVIVLRYPLDVSQHFIKRVVGLPGETLVVKDGYITIREPGATEAKVLDESAYLPLGTLTAGDQTITLAPDEYFVMGDNRGASLDSRSFGPLPRADIVGSVWIRGWPPGRFTTFESDKPKHS